MSEPRHHIQELNEYLHQAFEGFVDFHMNCDPGVYIDPYYGAHQKVNNTTYTLEIAFSFEELRLLKADYPTNPCDPRWREDLMIGRHRPVKIESQVTQYPHPPHSIYTFIVKYQVSDLDDFLDELKKIAYEREERKMNDLIDSVLETE